MKRLGRFGDPLVGALAAGLSVAIVFAGEQREGPAWANVAAFLAYGGLLSIRSRQPVASTYGFAAVLLLLSVALTPPPENVAIFFGLLLFAYAVGTAPRTVGASLAVVAVIGGIAAANLADDGSTPGDWIFPSAITLAAYVAGRNNLYRAALAVELHEAALRAEEAQAALASRAVAAERRRIARELHDVVAHSISVMVVQAGGARRVLARDPARAEQAAAQIERTGRETLTEMRRLLGMMHGGSEPAELEPTPTLADLAALCERAGAAFTVEGVPRAIGVGLAVGAFRVVQEALADAARTVPGSEPVVTVEWSDNALELRIADDRPYAGPELPGVRERVALYEGEVRSGPRLQGDGHQLVVTFPLHESQAAIQGA